MREEKRILRCLNCGQEFEPTCHKTRQKFCCAACRQKYHNARRYYNVPVNICPECGCEINETIYIKDGMVIGCENCVKRFDASDADADRYFDEAPDRY